jgi:SAM-dependent methyltransferase
VTVLLRRRDGTASHLALERWSSPATRGELDILSRLQGPVLDVGCGPGRLVAALAERGAVALGVDASPTAVHQTMERGAAVLCRSIFDSLPGEGRWRAVLLFDGNIGIGGDPTALLDRARALIAPSGAVLVEVGPPGSTTALSEARVELPDHAGPWFPWAWVGADRIGDFAGHARLQVTGWSRPAGRWIAHLEMRR